MSRPGELAPVVRESTVSHVARVLRTAIMYGELAPGAQLGEAALAEALGVSRGPLREAMQRLVQEGIVRSEPNRGLFVIDFTDDDVRDVYAARAAIERAAAAAILRGDPQAAADRLEDALRQMHDAAESDDVVALTDADLAFHESLVRLARSPRLQRMHDTLLVETRMCMAAANDTYTRPVDALKEHLGIVEALRSGDAGAVEHAIDAHMADALARLGSSPTAPAPPS